MVLIFPRKADVMSYKPYDLYQESKERLSLIAGLTMHYQNNNQHYFRRSLKIKENLTCDEWEELYLPVENNAKGFGFGFNNHECLEQIKATDNKYIWTIIEGSNDNLL